LLILNDLITDTSRTPRLCDPLPMLFITSSTRPERAPLIASALLSTIPWWFLAQHASAFSWSDEPLPFERIRQTAWHFGSLTESMLLLMALLAGYIILAWVVETSETDIPGPLVIGVSICAGLLAWATYALFAEDVNYLLANIWTFSVNGQNPYEISVAEAPGNPFAAFTSWSHQEYLYGPLALPIGSILLRLTGVDVVGSVLGTKALMLLVIWVAGGVAWAMARFNGWRQPNGIAALILWNPLILAESAMTPHLDLAMSTLLMLAVLSWMRRRESLAIIFLAASVAVKLLTAMLVPIALVGIGLTLWQRGWTGLRTAICVTVLVSAATLALWPAVWQPLLENGVHKELEERSDGALLPNVVTSLDDLGLIEAAGEEAPWTIARTWRWLLFVPFWLLVLVLGTAVSWRHRAHLPQALFAPLALTMLGYHAFFSLVVLPWHFITALCLCLMAGSRAGRLAGVLITMSGMMFHVNDRWVWAFDWADPSSISRVLGLSLFSGPLLAVVILSAQLAIMCGLRPYPAAAKSEHRMRPSDLSPDPLRV
jgi:hypothetical protein